MNVSVCQIKANKQNKQGNEPTGTQGGFHFLVSLSGSLMKFVCFVAQCFVTTCL